MDGWFSSEMIYYGMKTCLMCAKEQKATYAILVIYLIENGGNNYEQYVIILVIGNGCFKSVFIISL